MNAEIDNVPEHDQFLSRLAVDRKFKFARAAESARMGCERRRGLAEQDARASPSRFERGLGRPSEI